jgi:predicted aspartyl protease
VGKSSGPKHLRSRNTESVDYGSCAPRRLRDRTLRDPNKCLRAKRSPLHLCNVNLFLRRSSVMPLCIMHFRNLGRPRKLQCLTRYHVFITNAYFRRVLFRFLVIFATVAGLFWMSARAHSQEKRLDSALDLDMLLSMKQYPQLEQALAARSAELDPKMQAYFAGVVANRVNQVKTSLGLLQPLVPGLLVSEPRRGEIVLCTIADDYAKSFRYADAARVYTEANLIAKRQNLNSSCDAAREASRWALFRGAPVQTVTSSGEFTIVGKWDSMGLFQVPLTAGGYSGSWIIDSGANLSIISQSVAERIGIEVSSGTDTADGSSGGPISVHVGIIPELRLGSAIFQNVPVLVAADSDLTFPPIDYQIEGSLGLPELAALGRFTVYQDGRIRFGGGSETSGGTRGPYNFFLERFTPLITADFGLGDQLFTIDTGAVGTILSADFYHESGPLNSAELVELELVGAGGTLVAPAYRMRDVRAKLGGSCAKLETVQVLTQATGLADEFYGNIGQSALSSFASFTLDFNAMHFSASGGSAVNCSREN